MTSFVERAMAMKLWIRFFHTPSVL